MNSGLNQIEYRDTDNTVNDIGPAGGLILGIIIIQAQEKQQYLTLKYQLNFISVVIII